MTSSLIYYDDYVYQNTNIMQKDIFRLAALLYSEMTDTYSNVDVQLHIVKCILTQNENQFMFPEEILSKILVSYKYNLSEEELEKILTRPKTFETSTVDGKKVYRLLQDEYDKTNQYMSRNIDFYISKFIEANKVKDDELCRDAIYKYLYELTTTNINSYKVLLSMSDNSNFTDSELSISLNDFSDVEREFVYEFIEWNNYEKNTALSNIVLCCLEYCLLVSGDKPNSLISKKIRNHEIFIDTNIIFRALGINGLSRKNVIDAFLRKCNQSKIKIFISRITKKEFWDTIDHHISQIKAFPRGKVFKGAYESLSDYNLYSFYDEWREKHENLSLVYFKMYIQSLYTDFINKYKIHDEEFSLEDMLNTPEFMFARDNYTLDILKIKKELKPIYISEDSSTLHYDNHDASMVRYIELYRNQHTEERNVFFVSSDKSLRYWDMTREGHKYPVVIYPSQLFLVLVKFCGRSENDMESFVSFINIRPRSQQLNPEKANIILSGISSITEDIMTQKHLVSTVFDEGFQNIIKHSNTDQELYRLTQVYSQKYLEDELKSKDNALQTLLKEKDLKDAHITELEKVIQKKEYSITEIREEKTRSDEELRKKASELEAYRERICEFAEKRILPAFLWRWYILPALILLYTVFGVVFIVLQFLYCNASWNFVNKLLNNIANTTFGKGVENYIYIIDGFIIATISALYRKVWKNPLNKAKQMEDKALRVERYIKNNQLQ